MSRGREEQHQDDDRSGLTMMEAYLAMRRMRVLLAEDDDEMRSLLSAKLRRRGFEVVAVRSGDELLHQLRNQIRDDDMERPFDLVISDVRMPGVTGLSALEEYRENDWSTPFILITGFGDKWVHQEADRLGAYRVFDKPFDVDEMLGAALEASAA